MRKLTQTETKAIYKLEISKEHTGIQHQFFFCHKRELLPQKTEILSWQNVKRQRSIKGHIKVKHWLHNHQRLSENLMKSVNTGV